MYYCCNLFWTWILTKIQQQPRKNKPKQKNPRMGNRCVEIVVSFFFLISSIIMALWNHQALIEYCYGAVKSSVIYRKWLLAAQQMFRNNCMQVKQMQTYISLHVCAGPHRVSLVSFSVSTFITALSEEFHAFWCGLVGFSYGFKSK